MSSVNSRTGSGIPELDILPVGEFDEEASPLDTTVLAI